VTAEYRTRLAADHHYQRLFANANSRDSAAHLAAYLYAKGSMNDSLRAFTALVNGPKPKSRVEVDERPGLRHISVPNRPALSLQKDSVANLPAPYHGSLCDWERILNFATQWHSDEQYQDLMALKLPGSTGEPTWWGRDDRHDAVLVLARESL